MVIRLAFIALLCYPAFAAAQDVNLDQQDRNEHPAILGDDADLRDSTEVLLRDRTEFSALVRRWQDYDRAMVPQSKSTTDVPDLDHLMTSQSQATKLAFPPGEVMKFQELYTRAANELLRQKVTGNLAPDPRSLRPEYVAAADSARWNVWWYVAAGIPLVLLLPAAIFRRFGPVALLLSLVGAWLAFTSAVNYYWDTKAQMASTEAEVLDATSDSARVYGPIFVGVPLVSAYVITVGGLVYGGRAIANCVRNKPARPTRDSDYEAYRSSLAEEYARLREDGSSNGSDHP